MKPEKFATFYPNQSPNTPSWPHNSPRGKSPIQKITRNVPPFPNITITSNFNSLPFNSPKDVTSAPISPKINKASAVPMRIRVVKKMKILDCSLISNNPIDIAEGSKTNTNFYKPKNNLKHTNKIRNKRTVSETQKYFDQSSNLITSYNLLYSAQGNPAVINQNCDNLSQVVDLLLKKHSPVTYKGKNFSAYRKYEHIATGLPQIEECKEKPSIQKMQNPEIHTAKKMHQSDYKKIKEKLQKINHGKINKRTRSQYIGNSSTENTNKIESEKNIKKPIRFSLINPKEISEFTSKTSHRPLRHIERSLLYALSNMPSLIRPPLTVSNQFGDLDKFNYTGDPNSDLPQTPPEIQPQPGKNIVFDYQIPKPNRYKKLQAKILDLDKDSEINNNQISVLHEKVLSFKRAKSISHKIPFNFDKKY